MIETDQGSCLVERLEPDARIALAGGVRVFAVEPSQCGECSTDAGI